MATRIEAIAAYRPRIDYDQTVTTEAIAEYIKRGTALNTGEILNVLRELNEAVIFYTCQGTPVKLDGLGIFRPTRNLDGEYAVRLRTDVSMKKQINTPGAFTGTQINPGNAGLTADELVAMWNEDHPDDPVEA